MTAPDPRLLRALTLSEDILSAAERADLRAFDAIAVERADLVRAFRRDHRNVAAADQSLLQQIAALNDRALGQLLHHRRAKARELDMAAVGRRAVAAYSTHAARNCYSS